MFGVDMGPSAQENSQYGNLNSASGFATNLGESDLSASSDFMKSILSGNASQVTQALAPQVSAAKVSNQQNNKTAAEFGTRSGGTAATTAASNDKTHADITNLIGSLTGGAASSLASSGSSLLSTGVAGDEAGFGEANTLQKQRASQFNDIFSSAASVAAPLLGAIPGGAGSFGDVSSNIAGGF